MGGRLSPRYALMIVGQLPEGSAFVAEYRGGPEFRPWTSTTHLLATLVNLTFAANRQRGGKATRKAIIEPPKRSQRKRTLTVKDLAQLQKKASGV